MKVTSTKCLDNKRHKWKIIHTHSTYGERRDHKWCKICGSVTETIVRKYGTKRCKDENDPNGLYIEIPEALK